MISGASSKRFSKGSINCQTPAALQALTSVQHWKKKMITIFVWVVTHYTRRRTVYTSSRQPYSSRKTFSTNLPHRILDLGRHFQLPNSTPITTPSQVCIIHNIFDTKTIRTWYRIMPILLPFPH